MLDDLLKKYNSTTVKTGQDLITLGVVPKTIEQRSALLAALRLKALRDQVRASLDPAALGKWVPLYAPSDMTATIAEGDEVLRKLIDSGQLKPGMQVKGIGLYNYLDFKKREGVIDDVVITPDATSRPTIGVSWKLSQAGQDTLQKTFKASANGHYTGLAVLQVAAPEDEPFIVGKKYDVMSGAVFDKALGHKIRFTAQVEGTMTEDRSAGVVYTVPQGTHAMLVERKNNNGTITFRVDTPLAGDKRVLYSINEALIRDIVEVSSLGQQEPLDLETSVRDDVLTRFLAKTVLPPERASLVVNALLAGKDLAFHGEPGTGKSSAAADIIDLLKLEGILFRAKSPRNPDYICQYQCNPFSLFDEQFAKLVDACSDCKKEYDPNCARSGIFTRPKPKDVLVEMVKLDYGTGIEVIDGTQNPQPMNMIGFKIPDFDVNGKTQNNSAFDSTGYMAGKVPRSNNGALVVEEIDKMRVESQNNLLQALQDNVVSPDMQRDRIPARSLIVGTANRLELISEPLKDRVCIIGVPQPTTVEGRWQVMLRSRYKLFAPTDKLEMDDIHTMQPLDVNMAIMPAIVGKTIAAFYNKFGAEYDGEEKRGEGGSILGSNRSLLDACAVATCELYKNQIFFASAPLIVLPEYALFGIQFALRSRVQMDSDTERKQARGKLTNFIDEHFPKLLRDEKDSWWCTAYKQLGIAATQIPQIKDNLRIELAEYEKDPRAAIPRYDAVKKATANQNDRGLQLARVQSPFINYLMNPEVQPGFASVQTGALAQLIGFYMQASKESTCKLEP